MSEIYYDAQGNVVQPTQGGQQPAQNGYPQQGMSQQYPQQGMGQPPAQLDPANLPAHLQGAAPQSGNALDAGAGVGGPRLSIKGKQFRFIENDQERVHPFGQPLHVVMVIADPHEGVAKNFYEGSYVEGQDVSPVCYSSDGVTPDSGAEKPQCATCAGCPHNKFGTAVQQDGSMGKGKACRDFKRVYVIPYDQPASDVYEMRVPPTSFKAMQNYGRELSRAGVPLHGAVTTLNFTSDTSPVLTFGFSGFIDQGAYAKIDRRIKSGELDSVLPSKNKTPSQVEGQATPVGGLGLTHQPETGHVDNTVHPQEAINQGAGAAPQPSAVQSAPAPAQQTQPAAPNAPTPAPCPLGAPSGFKMTGKQPGVTYQAFKADPNWTDQLLVQHGYMVQAG